MLSQLVTNGTFSTNSVWNLSTNAVIGSGVLTVTVTGGVYERAFQYLDYVAGAQYRVTAIVSGTASSQMRFRDAATDSGGLPIAAGIITFTGSPQKIELIWTPNANSDRIAIERHSSGDFSFTVDNVIISKLTPFNDIIKPADVPTPIFNNVIRTFAGEEPWQIK